MVPDGMFGFFQASVGASAALIGLLFVAISISPERIITSEAAPERRATASSAFTALLNVFFISLVALIPATNLGYVVVVFGLMSSLGTISLVINIFTKGRRGERQPTLRERFRLLLLPLASLVVYIYELYWAYLLFSGQVKTIDNFAAITYILIGAYAIGITRAWELIFDERHGLILTLIGIFLGRMTQTRSHTKDAQHSPAAIPQQDSGQPDQRAESRTASAHAGSQTSETPIGQ